MTSAGWAVVAVIVGAMAVLMVLGPRWGATDRRRGPESKSDEEHEQQS